MKFFSLTSNCLVRSIFTFALFLLLSANSSAGNLYWINGSGNWNDVNHWSASSGGSTCSCIPTSADNVFFDANSFTSASKAVNINVSASCKSMDWTGSTSSATMTGTSDLNVYGSFTLVSTMNNSFTGILRFKSIVGGNTITSAGKTFTNEVDFDGVSGDWTLQDPFNSTTGNVYLVNGILKTNDKNFTCNTFSSTGNNVRGIVLGASLVTLNSYLYNSSYGYGGWFLTGNNYSLDAGTSTIKFNSASYATLYGGGSDAYYNLLFQDVTTTGNVYGGNSFNTVTCNGNGNISTTQASFNTINFLKDGTTSGNNNTYPSISFPQNGTIGGNNNSFPAVSFALNGNISGTNNSFTSVKFMQGATLGTGSQIIGRADFMQNGTINGNNTFDSLFFTDGKTYTLGSNNTQTINKYLKCDGFCSQPLILSSSTSGTQANISSPSGNRTVNYVRLKDINVSGGATFVANNSIDAGNNTGWTLNAPTGQNLYWIGGSGNWNDASHWSNTSGGAASACIPTRFDNVFFDANSFTSASKAVNINVVSSCANMDWTNSTTSATMTGASDLNIYGSLTFSPTMNNSFSGLLYFKSMNGGNTITSAGKIFTNDVVFDGVNGDWTLQDAFTVTTNVYLSNGIFKTNNKNITFGAFSSSGSNVRGIVLGTSFVNINSYLYNSSYGYGGWFVAGSNYSIDAGSSNIKLNSVSYATIYIGASDIYNILVFQDATVTGYVYGGNSFNTITFNGPGVTTTTQATFNAITFMKDGTLNGNNNTFPAITFPQNGTISGNNNSFSTVYVTLNGTISGTNNSFTSVKFMQTGTLGTGTQIIGKADFMQNGTINGNNAFDSLLFANGKTYTLGSSNTQTINKYWRCDGSCSLPLVLSSSTAGTQANVSCTFSNATINYVRLKDINATGGAVFVANNSTDAGNNKGWTINFPAGQNLYWIGGSGNWNDPTHWSTTSGGASVSCIPTRYDNVFFDASSFTPASKAVNINIIASCANMSWVGSTPSAIITGASDLNIFGSLVFSPTMNNSFTGLLYFKSNNGNNIITSAGKTFTNDIYFDGVNGDWTMQDAFATSADISLVNGILKTNNKNLTCAYFSSPGSNVRGLILGSSLVTINSYAYNSSYGYGAWVLAGSNYSLDAGISTIKINATSYPVIYAGSGDVYYNVLFQDPTAAATINGGNAFDSVTFNGPGTTNTTAASFGILTFTKAGTISGNNNSFNKANFLQNGTINGNNNFDTLFFTAGKTYTLENQKKQFINYYLKANGASGSLININSNTSAQAIISKTSCIVCCSYLNLNNINANGGASFYAASSTNGTNNSGWNFAACPASSFGVTVIKDDVTCNGGNNGKASVVSSCGNGALSYVWSNGGTTATITNLTAGTYSVTVTDNLLNINTGSVIVTEPAVLTSGFTYTKNGLTVTPTNTSAGATTYYWKFGDGNTSTLQNPVYTYYYGGNYNICLIASNSCGSDTACQTVSVICTPPLAAYSKVTNGLTISFTNLSTDAANILWDFGDGTTSTSLNPLHTYINSGNYLVCLSVSNGCGNDKVCYNVPVTCSGPPTPSYTSSVNGMTVNFTNTSLSAAFSLWDFGDGKTSTSFSPTHVYYNSGLYNVKLRVSNGCGKDSVTHSVVAYCAMPAASFISNPQSLAVDFISTSYNAATVKWNFGDGSPISILPVVNHIYATTGTYLVCLTAINGCDTNTFCQTVSVCAPSVANFTTSVSGLTATFNNTSTNGINYYWTFGDANASNQKNPVHIYSTPGNHNVCLTTDNNCGSNQVCKNVYTSCSAFTIQNICMVTVDSLSTHTIIYWEKPVTTDIDSFRLYREVTAGTYDYVASIPYDSLSEYHDYTADPNATSYKYKLAFVDTCGAVSSMSNFHSTIHLQNLGNGNFQWTLYDMENAGNPVNYYRLYRDDNSTGAFLPVSLTIPGGNTTYTDVNYATYPNANYRVDVNWNITCTPTRSGINTTRSNIKASSAVISVEELMLNNAIQVYPNPATDMVTIQYPSGNKNYQLKIFDALGQLVYNEALANTAGSNGSFTKQIDVSGFRKGIYIVSVQTENGNAFKRLTIQ